jgi:hypothetical protein
LGFRALERGIARRGSGGIELQSMREVYPEDMAAVGRREYVPDFEDETQRISMRINRENFPTVIETLNQGVCPKRGVRGRRSDSQGLVREIDDVFKQ